MDDRTVLPLLMAFVANIYTALVTLMNFRNHTKIQEEHSDIYDGLIVCIDSLATNMLCGYILYTYFVSLPHQTNPHTQLSQLSKIAPQTHLQSIVSSFPVVSSFPGAWRTSGSGARNRMRPARRGDTQGVTFPGGRMSANRLPFGARKP